MKYTFDCDRWGSSFSVPSKVVDKYIKLSDGDFVKVLLCILCSTERECDSAKLAEKSGLSENTVIDAVTHWVSLGVITSERSDTAKPAQVKAVSVRQVYVQQCQIKVIAGEQLPGLLAVIGGNG